MSNNIGTYIREQFQARLDDFDPASWKGGDVTILYDITGQNGGQWTFAIEDGQSELREGAPESPDVTISASSEHLRAMMDGKLNPLTAQLQGKVQFRGNTALLLKLRQVLA
jgi:putative sterol carrier protein